MDRRAVLCQVSFYFYYSNIYIVLYYYYVYANEEPRDVDFR